MSVAGEIQLPLGLTGRTCYALVRNAVGQIYAGATAGTYATASYATYPIALTEQGTASGFYVGDFSAVPAGVYGVEVRLRAGISPAETDLPIASGHIEWGGSATVPLSSIKSKTDNLPSSPAAVGSPMTLADGAITEAKISTPSESAGIPTGILAMIRRIFERGTNKQTRDRSTGTFSLRNAADAADLETATQSTSGSTDTISGKS